MNRFGEVPNIECCASADSEYAKYQDFMEICAVDSGRETEAAYTARLEAARLAAEFHTPLTRENVRHRLKRGRGPVQLTIDGPAPEPDKQGELF